MFSKFQWRLPFPCFPSSGAGADKVNRELVQLNVYDMLWLNDYTSIIGFGVFHSGVQVYDTEFAYGGHPFPFTGIFEIMPRQHQELGEQFQFRQSIKIGYTDFGPDEVRHIVEELGNSFCGNRYHLIQNNCNHFTGALTRILCGQEIPAWVNRLANVSSCVPLLQRCLPHDWLTPCAVMHNNVRGGGAVHRTLEREDTDEAPVPSSSTIGEYGAYRPQDSAESNSK